MLEMLEDLAAEPVKKVKADKKEEEKTEPTSKVEKKPVVKKVKTITKTAISRSDAVAQAIRKLCVRGATIKEVMDASDTIYVKAGGQSNPSATNVNRYAIHALVAFEVLSESDATGIYKFNK